MAVNGGSYSSYSYVFGENIIVKQQTIPLFWFFVHDISRLEDQDIDRLIENIKYLSLYPTTGI